MFVAALKNTPTLYPSLAFEVLASAYVEFQVQPRRSQHRRAGRRPTTSEVLLRYGSLFSTPQPLLYRHQRTQCPACSKIWVFDSIFNESNFQRLHPSSSPSFVRGCTEELYVPGCTEELDVLLVRRSRSLILFLMNQNFRGFTLCLPHRLFAAAMNSMCSMKFSGIDCSFIDQNSQALILASKSKFQRLLFGIFLVQIPAAYWPEKNLSRTPLTALPSSSSSLDVTPTVHLPPQESLNVTQHPT